MAEITMTLEEYKKLDSARDEALREVSTLRAQLVDAKLSAVVDSNQTSIRRIVELTRALLEISRFAVGQLPPETNKGWPIESVKRASVLLVELPDSTVDDVSIASEFRAFAIECERVEAIREER